MEPCISSHLIKTDKRLIKSCFHNSKILTTKIYVLTQAVLMSFKLVN